MAFSVDSTGLEDDPMAGPRENVNKPSSSIKAGNRFPATVTFSFFLKTSQYCYKEGEDLWKNDSRSSLSHNKTLRMRIECIIMSVQDHIYKTQPFRSTSCKVTFCKSKWCDVYRTESHTFGLQNSNWTGKYN
jgi:hypothetical protein